MRNSIRRSSGTSALRSGIARWMASRAFDRVYDAWKFDEDPVAGQLDDAALTSGDLRLDEFGLVLLQALVSVPTSLAPIRRL